jgi:hypothetical protein
VRSISGGDGVPEAVRGDIARAAELWESLRADGKQLRYEIDAESGRVSAELRDLEGAQLHLVPLAEALGAGDDSSPAA